MQFSTITVVFTSLLASTVLATPTDSPLSIPPPTLKAITNPLPAAPLPGSENFMSCAATSDCVVQRVQSCCGGKMNRCMNKDYDAKVAACKPGMMGICIVDEPGNMECSCQVGRCWGVRKAGSEAVF